MHLLGIDRYPTRWKRIISFAGLLSLILVVEGIAALIWLLLEPSEPGSRVFLNYSLVRWLLVLSTSVFILFVSLVLWNIKTNFKKVLSLLEKFEQKKFGTTLLVSLTLLVFLIVTLIIWLSQSESAQPYYFRLLPLLALATATVFQVWIVLALGMRGTIAQSLRAFFPIAQDRQTHSISNRYLLLGLIGLSLVYLALQFGAYLDIQNAVPLGDTTSFFEGASLKLSDPAFFSERRPWGILLTYKLLGSSFAAIEIAQMFVSTFAWLALAWIFSRSLRKQWGKVISFVVVLGFSLPPTVQVWNHAAMSESFTISFMILIFGLLVALMQNWKWSVFFLLILLFAYWMSIHEVNLYIGLLASIVFFIVGAFRKQYRILWLLSFTSGAIFIINYQLSLAYGLPRWALPVAEVITIRILPNPEYLAFFSRHGMPVTPELIALSGRWAHSDNYAIINSIELRSFSKWLFNRGNTVYAGFLLSHPYYAIRAPLEDIQTLLATDFLKSISIPNYIPALPNWFNELFYPIRWFSLYLWIALITVGLVFAKRMRTNERIYWLVFFFFLLSIPYLYITWHGDALDVARHAVIANIQFHLGVWLLLLLYIENYFQREVQHEALSSTV